MIKSTKTFKIELGTLLPNNPATRLEMILELAELTVKNGKPGRPKKMFTKKQLRELLGFT